MLYVLSCLVQDHDLRYVIVAALVCLLGSYLSMRLFARSFKASSVTEKTVWICLTGFVSGCVIWTTHFLAMLGYAPGVSAGYRPDLTLLSLFIAIAGCVFGFAIAIAGKRTALGEAGGAVLGLGIASMHYTGMAAYDVPGSIIWDDHYVIVSVLLGAFFGAVAVNRIIRPISRFCKYGGTLALVLAIVTTHFTAMAAVQLVLEPMAALPNSVVSPMLLGFSVLSVMLVLMGLAAATYILDLQTTQAAVARYRHLSLHDALTGLPNRAAFHEQLAAIENQPRMPGHRTAVLSFDLNRFKEINDVHGHGAGDAVLQVIGQRLRAVIGFEEFIARIGGDEFVVISQKAFGRHDANALANRLLVQINQPIDWNANRFNISSSVGVAFYDQGDLTTTDTVVAQADVAMYRAKALGPNNVCFYDPSMDAAVRERNALAMDLRHAVAHEQLEVFYQAQHETVSGELVGFEALLRWNHPTRGRIPPAEFIPIAERSGLIGELGAWVLHHSCAEAARWAQPYGIAVNVAVQQLSDPQFPLKVATVLEKTGLAPQRLELEITESGLIEEQERALIVIRQLKDLGVKIAMDDYGTGYSSLSTLMSFPFDKIKIDRSFVDRVNHDQLAAAIVRSTVILAHSMNIPVLAEGVETAEHVDFLRNEGCELVQGYFYGKPMPREDIDCLVNPAGGELPDAEISRVA